MIFRTLIKLPTSEYVIEDYDINTDDPVKHTQQIIDEFNRYRPAHPRTFITLRIISKINDNHEYKKMNLVTIMHKGRSFDTYQCKKCKVTAKRYGLSSSIVRDDRYRNDKFNKCKG